jgi:hypothetical protein
MRLRWLCTAAALMLQIFDVFAYENPFAIVSRVLCSRGVNFVSPPASGFSPAALVSSRFKNLRAIIGESGEPPSCNA